MNKQTDRTTIKKQWIKLILYHTVIQRGRLFRAEADTIQCHLVPKLSVILWYILGTVSPDYFTLRCPINY